MDVYTLSFTYPRSDVGVEGGTTVEAVHSLCVQTMASVPCSVSYIQADDARSFHWHVSGGYSNVMAARAFILRECPVVTRSSIPVPRSEILDLSNPNAPALNAHVRTALDDIASSTLAHIAVVNTSTATAASSLEKESPCHLVVTGPSDTVSLAQVRLLVMLDELSGLHTESVDIDCKLHPIIAGRKRLRVQHIQEETATNIYFPYPLRGMVGGPAAPNPNAKNSIYITGEFFGVQRAKDMLFQVARNKSKVVISRETAIQPRKLDWLLTDRLEDLKQIMSDTAAYLDVPSLGSGIINVFGDGRQNIQKAIKAVMVLTTQYIHAQFYLLPTHFNLLLPPPTALLMTNPAQVTPMLKHLTALTGNNGMNAGGGNGGVSGSGADIVFRENVFEFFGGIDECRRGIVGVADLAIAKSYHHEIRFALELAQEHREFISGKKNGKINKIMQLTGCKIRFEGIGGDNNIQPISPTNSIMSPTTPTTATSPTFTTFSSMVQGNFTITLSAQTLPSAMDGLALLLDEMPSEISFHVPEAYHKRIIGVGGRSVQRIMKKWGVFVKFFNSEGVDENGDAGNANGVGGSSGLGDGTGTGGDTSGDGASGTVLSGGGSGGVGEGEDNVVARTPAKNAMNLENLKTNVLELVNPKDKDFTIETVAIPRRYHRILMGEKSIFIKDIESKTGSRVRFPDRELASDIVTILGPESQVHIAAARLLDHVPFEAELTLPVPSSHPSNSTNGANSTRSSPRSHRSTSSSPDITLLCASPDFAAFIERVKREYGVVLTATLITNPSNDGSAPPPSVKFKFRCQKSTSDVVPAVREALESWLVGKGVSVYAGSGGAAGGNVNGAVSSIPMAGSGSGGGGGSGQAPVVMPHHAQTLPQPVTQQHVHKRADSFADAFPHFNSKLLSGAGGSQDGASLLNRRIRMATSSPDVKALFNRHSSTHSLHQQATKQVYNLPEHDEQDDEGFEAPTVPESPGEYYVPRMRHAPSISFIPRMSTTVDTYGGSNASSLEESLNSVATPNSNLNASMGAVSADGKIRSLTNRAQSLDLTSLNRKGGPVVTSSRDSVRIPSPVDNSPPHSATAIVHSFPSVYGPPPTTGSGNGIYTHQNHHSYSSSTPHGYQYQPQPHGFNYTSSAAGGRPRTRQVSSLSLSSSSSSLSLHQEIEVDDVSRVLEQIRLDGLH
ncbi:hypothetical protein FRB94_000336 [Tulasnella sp. JGI-2019a]|nr:hypothetical protein FRB93_006665 [Tulasnella sp. JGI-2019a]KAG9006831.1 hypothetical protein FRB94_000336 [Tulasnella sp. JGI-2019a]